MTTLTINEINYHVKVQGSGVPLVLLHGFTGSMESWSPLAEILAQYYTVIRVDLLGHGATDAPLDPGRYRMEAATPDLVKLLHALSAAPVNLLGYSMGGRLALYLAVHFPEMVRSLILESASPGLADPAEREARRARDDALADRIEREGIERFVDYWQNLPLFASQRRLPAETQADLRAQRLQNRPIGLANSLRGMGTGVQPSLWTDLPRLAIPVLLLVGELDAKFLRIAEDMEVGIRRARLKIIPDAGHTTHLENPDVFTGQLVTFVHMVQFTTL
jgi:2-succinyl-6-hydroxy-2,4-cyclohexadiene-1-carboxylate synthase